MSLMSCSHQEATPLKQNTKSSSAAKNRQKYTKKVQKNAYYDRTDN